MNEPPLSTGTFRYQRRVEFAETDMAGIVHFSTYFRYMEEAEHALWRAAGMSIVTAGGQTAWPRLSAAFDFRSPLRFEEDFEVAVSLGKVTSRTIEYLFTITRAEASIGTGRITIAHVSLAAGGAMRAIQIPAETMARLRSALS